MRSAHHDSIFVGQFGIQRIIFIEGTSPHGGPEKIATQAEDEFEDLYVKFVVISAKFFLRPSGKCGRFIIQKDAAVLDGGLALKMTARLDEESILMRDGHICPPIPGRNADLLGEFVNAVDSSALVATDNDESGGDTGKGVGHGLDEIRLPLPCQRSGIDLVIADQLLKKGAFTQRGDDYGRLLRSGLLKKNRGRNRRLRSECLSRDRSRRG